MKNFQHFPRRWQRVARMCGEGLILEAGLRQDLLNEMRAEAVQAANLLPGRFPARRGCRIPLADRRAFAGSVAFERLGEFCLCLGMEREAARAFRDAALLAADGEQYDHGEVSLPSRFLRIRFYTQLERLSACRGAAGEAEADELLAAEVRRLRGGDL